MIDLVLGWIKACLAFLAGRSAGEAATRAAQTQETADAAQRIAAAENAAPVSIAGLIERLRDGGSI